MPSPLDSNCRRWKKKDERSDGRYRQQGRFAQSAVGPRRGVQNRNRNRNNPPYLTRRREPSCGSTQLRCMCTIQGYPLMFRYGLSCLRSPISCNNAAAITSWRSPRQMVRRHRPMVMAQIPDGSPHRRVRTNETLIAKGVSDRGSVSGNPSVVGASLEN